MRREWSIGETGETAKGKFAVKSKSDRGYMVEYISGDWKGKRILMPWIKREPHHELETLNLSPEEGDKLLDIFYQDFSREYELLHRYLERVNQTVPGTAEMIELIREELPGLLQISLEKYLQELH